MHAHYVYTYGISFISEQCDGCMYEAFRGLSGYCCIIDDIVIYDSDASQHAYMHVATM